MATIYLTEQGCTISKCDHRLIIEKYNGEQLSFLTREIQQILLFGNIQLTTQAVSSCLQSQIMVLFLSYLGKYKGHLWSNNTINLNIQQSQFNQQDDSEFQLAIAKAVIIGKLQNSKQLLLRLNRHQKNFTVDRLIKKLTLTIKSLASIDNVDNLRGYEGIGTAHYYSAFDLLITNYNFAFERRSRRPPANPFNSLLSFGYTLLFNNILSLIIAEQLCPYLGHLHYGDRQKPYLAFDLMEEFRSPIVDSLVFKIVNQSLIKIEDFEVAKEGGFYLNSTGRKNFIRYFEQRINNKVTHPAVQDRVTYRRAIQLQIKRYKKSLLSGDIYQSFLRAR